MSKMLDEIKKAFAGGETVAGSSTGVDRINDDGDDHEVGVEEPPQQRPPLEEAIDKALYALGEIRILASYGSSQSMILREAEDALATLTELKTKWMEQNEIIEILSSPDGMRHTSDENDTGDWEDGGTI